MNNREAAQSGDRRKALEVLRDTLAEMLDTTEAQIHAQLAAQYRATLSELAALPPAEGKSASERLADRVAAAQLAS
jgi:uncharacterized protein (DUF2267 family)